jgi:V8-like Glu-specific endopeptidase
MAELSGSHREKVKRFHEGEVEQLRKILGALQILYKTFPYRLTGKLFFTIPNQGDFVCSGASVNSTNRSVVWTSGHCVFTPGVGFNTNFLFVPARRAGANPFGTWTVKQAFTLTGFSNNGLFEFDMGALVMNLAGTRAPTHPRISSCFRRTSGMEP